VKLPVALSQFRQVRPENSDVGARAHPRLGALIVPRSAASGVIRSGGFALLPFRSLDDGSNCALDEPDPGSPRGAFALCLSTLISALLAGTRLGWLNSYDRA
jgi:hypothetical protein